MLSFQRASAASCSMYAEWMAKTPSYSGSSPSELCPWLVLLGSARYGPWTPRPGGEFRLFPRLGWRGGMRNLVALTSFRNDISLRRKESLCCWAEWKSLGLTVLLPRGEVILILRPPSGELLSADPDGVRSGRPPIIPPPRKPSPAKSEDTSPPRSPSFPPPAKPARVSITSSSSSSASPSASSPHPPSPSFSANFFLRLSTTSSFALTTFSKSPHCSELSLLVSTARCNPSFSSAT